jgi:hypothetical protein
MVSEHELWLLSFYRTSEISGSLFFGRLARSMKPGPIQRDLTQHFADEAMHAHYWNQCINELGAEPLKICEAYQDQYLEAAGMPVNLMEVLAITQVFEQRVISQYSVHSQLKELKPEIRHTLQLIMQDEKWHLEWIRKALQDMEIKYGKDLVEQTSRRFRLADRQVYEQKMIELEERFGEILRGQERIIA